MIQQLKEKIEMFRKSHRGLFDNEYDPDLNFYGIKSESLKFTTKKTIQRCLSSNQHLAY